MSAWTYTCFNCEENSPSGTTEKESTVKANEAGWVIGHCGGQAHYSCEACKELLFDPVPLRWLFN